MEKTVKYFLLLLISLVFLLRPENENRGHQMEENMTTQNPLDRPEIGKLLFYPRTCGKTAPPAGATDIDIEAAPGIYIGCRLFTADKQAPTILFFHGNGEIVTDYDEVGSMYTEQNINFLITDFRGYGWSGGSPSYSSLLDDSHILYKKLRQYLTDNGYNPDLLIMGRSLGSACAIELASTYNDEIKGLIIESGFAQTLALAKTLGIDITALDISEEDTFNNVAKIRKITKPTFILHGQMDTLIPLWQAEKLHAECGARSKELQMIPGANHNTMMAVGGIYYFQAIKQFVDRATGADDWRGRRKAFKERQKNRN